MTDKAMTLKEWLISVGLARYFHVDDKGLIVIPDRRVEQNEYILDFIKDHITKERRIAPYKYKGE
jgi:hypothetical protein